MNRFLIGIAVFFQIVMIYGQEENLYNHKLDETKWDEIRRNIRYENQPDGPGREWTYENSQEYQREKKRYQGGQGGNGSGGQGSGDGGYSDGASEAPEDYEPYSPPPEVDVSPSVFNGLGVLGYILLIAFALLVAFLIYKLFVNAERDGRKVKPIINLDEQAPTAIQ